MPGSDGSQFISMRKYGAANNPSVSGLKQPGSSRLVLPKVSGVGLTREEFLSSATKLNRVIAPNVIRLIIPPNLTYTSGSNVSFPPLDGATNYKLYNNSGDALILDLGTNTSFSIPSLINPPANLTPNTPYSVYVVGSNSLGPSPRSSTITFTTPPAPPTMTISGTNLTIPSSAGATNYRLISSPPIVPQPTITPGTTSFSSLGLTPGTAYTLSVATTGSNGIESLAGSTITVYTPPNSPGTVTYGAYTGSTAVVSWAAPSVGGVTGYNIYDGSTLYTTLAGTTITFGTLAGKPALASGTTFTNFSIKSYFNTTTNESASVPLSFQTLAGAPSQPTLTLVSKTTSSISLSWTPGSGSAPTGYILTQGGSPVTLSPVTLTSITISSGITAGNTYNYSLISYSGPTTNASPPATLTVYTPPNPTGTVTSSNPTFIGATLTWTAPTGGVTGYNIYNGTAIPANLYTTTTSISPLVIGSGALTQLGSGTTYTFNVTSYFNTTSNESTAQSVTFTTASNINPPTNVQVTAQTENSVSLSWTPPATGNKDGFYINTVTPSGSSTVYTVPGNATVSTYTITGLNAGTTYVWNIFTYYQTVSQRSTAVVVPTAFTNPLPPTGFTATPVIGGATLTWTAQTLPINADIIGYKIYNSPSGTTPAFTIAKTSPLSQVISGLVAGTSYTYYITGYGNRNATPVEATNRASVTFTVPTLSAPTNGRVFPLGSTTATMTWDPVNNGETGYTIYNGTTLYATLTGVVSSIALGSGSYAPLIQATTQSFNVKAYYGTVSVESSALNITFTTFNNYPTPTSIEITSTAETTATLTWTPVSGPYDGYFIVLVGPEFYYYRVPGVGTSTFTATGLPPGSAFRPSIYTYTGTPTLSFNPTFNNPILGVPALTNTIKTTIPIPPTNPSSSNVTNTTATISWVLPTTPTNVNSNVWRYNIYNGTTFVTYLNAPATTYDVTGLSANTSYTFNIKAASRAQTGADTESSPLAINFSTGLALTKVAGFPDPPDNLRVLSYVSSDSTGQYVMTVDDGSNGQSGRVWFSNDYGLTWRTSTPAIASNNFAWICCSVSADGNTAVIANATNGNSGVYICTTFKAQSGGSSLTWNRLGSAGSPGDSEQFNAIKISGNGTRIYALARNSNARAYVSTFSGGVWSNLTQLGTTTVEKWATVTCSYDGTYVYAGQGVGGGGKSFWRYIIGTSTNWERVDQSDYIINSTVCSDNGAIVYALTNESYLRVSTNYGATGSWTNMEFNSTPQYSIACSSDGSIVYLVNPFVAGNARVSKILNQDIGTKTMLTLTGAGTSNAAGVHISCSVDGSKIALVTASSMIYTT